MKRMEKRLFGILLTCVMLFVPVSQVFAASYDAGSLEPPVVLFPGDSLINIDTPVTKDGEPVVLSESDPTTWKNESDEKAYAVNTAEDGTLQLAAAGYVLTVEKGTSSAPEGIGGHKEHAEDEEDDEKDIAYYPANTVVTLKADDPEEGMVFAGWKVDAKDITPADASSAETTVTMPESALTVTAEYQAAQQTEAETEIPNAENIQSEWTDPNAGIEQSEWIDPNAGIEQGEWTDPNAGIEQSEWTDPNAGIEQGEWTDPNAGIEQGEWTDPNAGTEQGEWTDPNAGTDVNADPGTGNSQSEGIDPNAGNSPSEQTDLPQNATESETPGIFGQGDDTAIDITTSDDYNSDVVNYGNGAETGTEAETAPPAEPVLHTLTVINGAISADGSAAGTYAEGSRIELSAAAPEEGKQFSGWSAVTENGEAVSQEMFSDAGSASTVFTIPAGNVTVTAAYVDMPYRAAVVNGSFADGTAETSCVAGTQLSLRAALPADGAQFSKWTARFTDTGALIPDTEFASALSQETTFTMPAGNVTLTAEYVTISTYTVQITSGLTVDGSTGPYAAGTQLTIRANDPQAGMQFSKWSAVKMDDGTVIADSAFGSVTSAETVFSVPACNVAVTAEYVPVQYKVTVANGLINNTAAEMMVSSGTVVTITANANPAGQIFSRWSVNNDTYDLGSNTENPTINVEITGDMSFAAIYEGISYTITVNDGSADYEEAVSGTEITLTADEAPEGMEFDYWKVDTRNVTLSSKDSEVTTFTMPAADVEISAYYKMKEYYVTVQNGYSDNDTYYMGQEVTVYSNYPSNGREFDKWTSAKNSVSFADASRWKTTFTMPAADVTVSASYKDGPSPNDNQIQDLAAGGEYLTNTTIKFTAVGAGMGNSNPNPGDYRYRPTGYQIGSVTGTWQASPYTTSMSIKAAGEYTLKVNYAKDVFDGNSWQPDGTSDAKNVTFRVVTPSAAVATGDDTPVAAMALLAGMSFLVLLVITCFKRKKIR